MDGWVIDGLSGVVIDLRIGWMDGLVALEEEQASLRFNVQVGG
jgi:hypothetical protein